MSIKREIEILDGKIEDTLHMIEWIKEDLEQNPDKKILQRELKAMESILNRQQRRRGEIASQLFT